jgi:hypothetical protein
MTSFAKKTRRGRDVFQSGEDTLAIDVYIVIDGHIDQERGAVLVVERVWGNPADDGHSLRRGRTTEVHKARFAWDIGAGSNHSRRLGDSNSVMR